MELRKDTFQFLRKIPVNLQKYLPRRLYSDETFAQTQNALNIEHERYRLNLIETAREFFVQTATEQGIDSFERLLKITPKGDLELRRKVIAMKLLRNFSMTLPNTRRLINEFIRTESGAADIEELGDNKIKLILNNGDFYWDLLYSALFEWLPAHLSVENIEIDRHFDDFKIFFAQPVAEVNFTKVDLSFESPPPLIIAPKIFVADISTCAVGTSNINFSLAQDLKFAAFCQTSEFIKIPCGDIVEDEESVEKFERYLRERYLKWKDAVIKYYKHHWKDGEIEDEEEYFPINTDFLRIYWNYPAENKNYIRYQTILRPKENLQAKDINYLSAAGISSQMLLHSKTDAPTAGILRALYIKKQEIKII